jgi:succinate-acetate transporter protein
VYTNRYREMAVGNTFGATALSSYGGFWIAFAIILTPGGFDIETTLNKAGPEQFNNSMGLFLMVILPSFLPLSPLFFSCHKC